MIFQTMHSLFIEKKINIRTVVRIALFFIFIHTTAQTSKDNHTGNWNSTSTWTGGVVPSTTIVGGNNFTINGYVTLSTSLNIVGGNFVINDTLVIEGNLTISGGDLHNNGANAVLIVKGNFTHTGGGVDELRYLIVGGEFRTDGGYNNNGSHLTFLFDSTPSITGGNNIACGTGTTWTNSGCGYGNTTDLQSYNPSLWGFVSGIICSSGAPTINTTTSGSNCGTGSVVLQASASAGIINWYNASSGGTLLGSGGSFTTSSISVTTDFFVSATNNGCTSVRTAVTATIFEIPCINNITVN